MNELIISKNSRSIGWWLDKTGTILAFIVMVVIFSILSPFFGSTSNIVNIVLQISPLLVTALGITFVNMAGESDLSLGGVLGLSATLFCGFLKSGMNPLLAFVAVIGICLAFGVLNGYLVAYIRLSSFIVTTAVMFIGMGLEKSYNNGFSIWIRNPTVVAFANGNLLGIPNLIVLGAIVYACTHLLLHQTKFGVHIQSVGESYETSNLMGIPVRRLKFTSFVIASAFYGLGGIMYAMRSSGAIVYSGQKVLLPALAVTFVARTVLGAKRPNTFGIIIGALLLGVINNAFTLMGVEFYYIPIAQGVVLVVAAALSTANKRDIQQENLD